MNPSYYILSSSGGDSTVDESTTDTTFSGSSHDTSHARHHIRDLETFAVELNDAAKSAFPNRGRSRYDTVNACCIRWAEGDLPVEPELRRLSYMFQDYGFSTEEWQIPTYNSHLALMMHMGQLIQEKDNDRNLFIIHYGGHGRINSERQAEWLCTRDANSARVHWSAIQTLFADAHSDVLILLDACAAASATTRSQNGSMEAIMACGFDSQDIAPPPGEHSFTNALIDVLDDWINRRSFSASCLHAEILSRLKLKGNKKGREGTMLEWCTTPIHINYNLDSQTPSIELCRRNILPGPLPAQSQSEQNSQPDENAMDLDSEDPLFTPPSSLSSLTPSGRFNTPHVLIRVAIEEDQPDRNVKRTARWLANFPLLANWATVEAVFPSYSTLLLLSLPVSIWNMLPDHPACSFVGYITAPNLIPRFAPADEEELLSAQADADENINESNEHKQYVDPETVVLPVSDLNPVQESADRRARYPSPSPSPKLSYVDIATVLDEGHEYDKPDETSIVPHGVQPDYEPSIQSFLSFLHKSASFEVVNPDPPGNPTVREFVELDKIKAYLQEQGQEKLLQIIAAVFPRGDGIYPNDVLPNNLGVFCTLLRISKGYWIKHFRHYESLSDARLPFDPNTQPLNWPDHTNDPDFLKRFCEEQWKFCVPVIRQPFLDRHFPTDTILPIVYKKNLHSRGSPTLYLIKLHPAYNKLIAEDDKVRLKDLSDTFVLKIYFGTDAATYYNSEVGAFRSLQQNGPNSGIVGFHGSFTRGDTYNILLEYADKGTLEDYFRQKNPPVESEEIITFWQALFKLVDALRRIHQEDGAAGPPLFQGWHQDVKPEKILVMSSGTKNPYDWQFKLAGLGTTHFRQMDAISQESTASDSYGTSTYGAPECYRLDETYVRDKLLVGQSVDIWSLGCVYSEAAQWISSGYQGVLRYRRERADEISEIPDFRDADCFHNGQSVLDAVRESLNQSASNLRTADFITNSVIETMIPDMLDVANARLSAVKLWLKSQRIVAEAKRQLQLGALRVRSSSLSHSIIIPEPRLPTPPNLPLSVSPRWSNSTHTSRPPSPPDEEIIPRSHSPKSMFQDNEWPQSSLAVFKGRWPIRDSGYGSGPSSRGPPSHSELSRPSTQSSAFGPHQSDMSGISPQRTSLRIIDSPAAKPNPSMGSNYSQSYSPSSTIAISSSYKQSNSRSGTIATSSSHPINIFNRATTLQYVENKTQASGVHNQKKSPESRLVKPLNWSVEDALKWKRERKESGTRRQVPIPQVYKRLRKRDHVFLIDDAMSMSKHWSSVVKIFEALAYIVKDIDPDGLDVLFTLGQEAGTTTKRTTQLVELVKAQGNHLKGTTDMSSKLSRILESYQADLERPKSVWKKAVRPLSLYILTDGIWEPNCDASGPIKTFVKQLDELGKERRQVGIQFISFGKDSKALERLNILHSGLGLKPNIVDHEPSSGDVAKMLLGSTNDFYDSGYESQ